MQPQSQLQRVLAELGIVPVYEYDGRVFYDTKDVFERHNFARDLKRHIDEVEWVVQGSKYYLTEHGIVIFAFKRGVSKVMEHFFRVLEMPVDATSTPMFSEPLPYDLGQLPPPMPMFVAPTPMPMPNTNNFYYHSPEPQRLPRQPSFDDPITSMLTMTMPTPRRENSLPALENFKAAATGATTKLWAYDRDVKTSPESSVDDGSCAIVALSYSN